MAKFKIGDKVKIIQRKKYNKSGTEPGWDQPNGNVGEIGYVTDISGNYCIRKSMTEGYFGWFDEDDLELASEEVSTTPYVKGKWYGCKDWRDKHDYVKFDYINSDKTKIYFTECIDRTKCKQINDWWGIINKELFEADMSIVSQFLPEGHPDKIYSKEFVLPKKWCIKVDKNCQPKEVYKWRQLIWVDSGYICHDKHWNHRVYSTHTEITLEQFKQHVLKESPVVETPKEENYVGRTIKALINHPEGTNVKKGEIIKIKEINYDNQFYTLEKTKAGNEGMVILKPLDLSNWELISGDNIDMQAIQEEAKRRFPIDCKFMNTGGDGPLTLIEDSATYHIAGKNIWAHRGVGNLYEDGKWATLVSLPSSVSQFEKTYFQKGDYIVTLVNDGNCGKVNYCSKQKEDFCYLKPEIDTKGSINNGNSYFHITDKSFTKWRYATPEEAAEYERIGKPYDVTTLQKKEESIPEYVECVSYFGDKFTGKIYNTKIDTPEKNSSCSWEQILIEHNRLKDGSFKLSTKEAYEAQFKQKKLKKEDLVEGEIYIYDDSHIAIYPEGPSFSIGDKKYLPYKVWLWTLSITHATEEQKALLRSYIKKKEEPIYTFIGDPIKEEIKKETFIENVQSVNVMLRTKKKSIKF